MAKSKTKAAATEDPPKQAEDVFAAQGQAAETEADESVYHRQGVGENADNAKMIDDEVGEPGDDDEPDDDDDESDAGIPAVRRLRCVTACRWNDVSYHVGQVFSVTGAVAIPEHFEVLTDK